MRQNEILDLSSRKDRDILQEIFRHLSPRDLAVVGRVCQFWYEQAQVRNLRSMRDPKIFFPWLIKNLEASFKKMNLFLSKKELVQFLLNDSLSLAAKIVVLDNLKKEIPMGPLLAESDGQRFFGWAYFPESFSMGSRRNPLLHSALKEYIDSLLPQMVQAFRGFNNAMREDIQKKFTEEVKIPGVKWSPELTNLLKASKQEFISLKQSFNSLQKIPTTFVNQLALEKSQNTLLWELPGAVLVVPTLLLGFYLMINSNLDSKAKTLFILVGLIFLRKILAYAIKFNSESKKAERILRQSEPEEDDHVPPELR